jgi:hypothetical protein
MAKRPGDRFASAAEAGGALRGVEPAPAPPSRQRWVIGAVITVVLAATVAVVASRDGDDVGSSLRPAGATHGPTIPVHSVVELDAQSGRILSIAPEAVPAVQAELPQVEVGEGAVWVLRGQILNRLAPDETATVEMIDLFSSSFQSDGLAVGYRTVWVGAPPGVIRIDPIDNDALRPIRLYPPGVFNGAEVSVGALSAWVVTGDGVLTRIDPSTGRQTGMLDLQQDASGIGVGFGGVWVIDELAGTLTRVDTEVMEADEPIRIGGSPEAIAVGAGGVWILDQGAGIVTTYDPSSGLIGSPIRVGVAPTDIATGLGAAWVVNRDDRTISRIDPVTRTVETMPIETADLAAPASIAVDEATGSLWVTVVERI